MANHAARAKRAPASLAPAGVRPNPKRRAKPRQPVVAVQATGRATTSADAKTTSMADHAAPASATPDVTMDAIATDTRTPDGAATTLDGTDRADGADAEAMLDGVAAGVDHINPTPDDTRLAQDAASAHADDADDADVGDDWLVEDTSDEATDENIADAVNSADVADDTADEITAADDDPADDANTATRGQAGEPNYYATLGVEPDATHDELRQAYRRLAKLWHPDRYVSAPPALRALAERHMRALNAAYFVVGDAIRRHLYDQRRAELAALAGNGAANSRGYGTAHNGRRAAADTDYTGYTTWSGASRQDGGFDHASENPNGAGIFFGALALVVGVGLFVGASQSGSAWVFVFGGVILVGLIALALIFTSQTSPFANAANRLMEGEPRGFGDPYVAAGAAGATGWRGTRYGDRPPRRATGARKGADARWRPTRNAPGAQAPTDGAGAPDTRGPAQAGAPTPNEAPTTSEATTDETNIVASVDAQPPDISDEAAAFARFQQYVVDAVEALPAEFREQMGNIVVRVADEPDAATLHKMSVGKGHTLFGLYEGVPLTKQGATLPPPEIVTIYRGPITRACQGDPARIREQARRTVFHEVAHHFGIDHDEMPEWVK